MTAGEVVDEAPRHGWPGVLYVMLMYAFAGAVLLVVGSWIAWEDAPAREGVLQAVAGVLVAGMAAGIAWSVQRFRPWGWWLSMLWLVGWLFTDMRGDLIAYLSPARGGSTLPTSLLGGSVLLKLLWIGYFWVRRRDFDVQLAP